MSLIWLHFYSNLKKFGRLVCTRFYAMMRHFSLQFDTQCTRSGYAVASFARPKSGWWRVQMRRKGKMSTNTFLRRKDAEEWALEVEWRIDRGEPP
jgi:hypothetical protein